MLCKLSLIMTLFALPLFFVEGLRGVSSSLLQKALADGAGEEALISYLNADSLQSLLYIPAWLILSVGLCGGYGLMRDYCFQEGVSFFATFCKALRENLKETLKLTAIFAAVHYLCHFSANFIVMQKPLWQIPVIMVEAVMQAILLGCYIFGLCQIPVYRNSAWQTAKNGVLFALLRLPKLLLVLLGSWLPLRLVWLLGVPAAGAAVLAVYIFIGFGHSILLTTLYCHHCFDEMINRSRYPEIYRKGLFRPEETV